MRAVNIMSNIFNGLIVGLTITGCVAFNEAKAAQLECLARNIYFEARSESVEGQRAVAHVTMNRVEHSYWPDTICEVVYQPYQFSWTHLIKDQVPFDKELYDDIYKVAEEVYNGEHEDNTDGSTFYYAEYIAMPKWAKQMEKVGQIDTHIFFKWDGTWD